MKLRCLILVAFAFLVLAPAALAAGSGSAGSGYGGNAGGVQNEVNQGAVNAAASKGSLPFTGLDLAMLVVGGLSLVVVGAGLRRASRRQTTT